MRFQRFVSSATPLLSTTSLLQGVALLGFSTLQIRTKHTHSSFANAQSDASPRVLTMNAASHSRDKEFESSTNWAQAVRSSSLEAYHLIWSPGAMRKMVIGTASIALVDSLLSLPQSRTVLRSGLRRISGFALFAPMSRLAANVVLPLLASSCCLIQISINMLAGGCAGFNTILGPVRPYFLSLLLYSTAATFPGATAGFRWYRLTIMRWSVALLPEALDVWNTHQEKPRKLGLITPDSLKATVHLDIPTMGCVACINKIDSALRNAGSSRVVEAVSSLNLLGAKGGQAKVRLVAGSREEMDQLVETLVRSVELAGFEPCLLTSVLLDE